MKKPPVVVDVPDVAGVEPPVRVDRRRVGRRPVAQVAAHHLRAADHDLAVLAGRERLSGRDVDGAALRPR